MQSVSSSGGAPLCIHIYPGLKEIEAIPMLILGTERVVCEKLN